MNPIYYLVPASPVLTVQRDSTGQVTTLCLDIETERVLQHQRKFAYTVAGPAVAVAGLLLLKDKPLYGLFITALGGACAYWHCAAFKKVEQALQSATPSSPNAET